MTPRPGRLARIFPIDLPRPRTIEMTFSPDFIKRRAGDQRDDRARGARQSGSDGPSAGSGVGRCWPYLPELLEENDSWRAELRETIPTFNQVESEGQGDVGLTNWSALTSQICPQRGVKPALIILVAVTRDRWVELCRSCLPHPELTSCHAQRHRTTLVTRLSDLFWPHMQVTLIELLSGFAIGASIGIVLAAMITQFPFVEKIITPYILLLVTTPMIALVPLLMLKYRLRHDPAHHRRGAGLGTDGDDQRGDRVPPHRPGEDRAGPFLWRHRHCRFSRKSASRWRCR